MKQFIKKNKEIIILIIIIIILAILFLMKVTGNSSDITNKESEINNSKITDFIKTEEYLVEYKVPHEFELKEDGGELKKFYTNNDGIVVHISIDCKSEEEYILKNNSNYKYYKDSNYYDSVELSDVKKLIVDNKEFNYQTLICKSKNVKIQNMNIWYRINDNYVFCVELEINNYNVELNDNIIDKVKDFLSISIQEN